MPLAACRHNRGRCSFSPGNNSRPWSSKSITGVVLSAFAAIFERGEWHLPDANATWAILYNAVVIFGYAHAAWFYLARTLPPVASTVSMMFIPVLGVFTGALWLGEILHWQDWAAVVGSVLWPAKPSE